jgi:NADH-quinone oxidoreductase subunit C
MPVMATSAEKLREIADVIISGLGADLVSAEVVRGELIVTVRPAVIVKTLTFLRDDPRMTFDQLTDICGADYPERDERFDVVYHLLSMKQNLRVRVKVRTGEEGAVPTACGVWVSANWLEREVWDMYGVFFSDHPDLRRILTDYGFDGFPQRKDFPLTGYVEVRYDEDQKRVIYEPVKLAQDFRSFDFLSPWEGIQRLLPGDEKAPTKQGGA